MRKKIRACLKTDYIIMSGYVVFTVLTIVAFSYLITKLDSIMAWFLHSMQSFFRITAPILIGAVVAWLLDPVVTWFEKYLCKMNKKKVGYSRKNRILAVIFTFLLIFGVILTLCIFAIYSISKQIQGDSIMSMKALMTNYLESFVSSLKQLDHTFSSLHLGDGIFTQMYDQIKNSIQNGFSNFTNGLMEVTMNVSSYIIKFSLGIILAIYFLIDKNLFLIYGNVIGKIMLGERVYNSIKRNANDMDRIFSGYVRGQTADVLFMSIATSLLLSIIGIRYGLLIGCIAGICNYIPYAGPFVAYIGTITFGFLNHQEKQVFIAILLLFVLQQIDGNYVGPKMMAKGVEIEPVFILIGVIIGGSIFGFPGMILAVPITAFLKLLFVRFLEKKLVKMERKEKHSENG